MNRPAGGVSRRSLITSQSNSPTSGALNILSSFACLLHKRQGNDTEPCCVVAHCRQPVVVSSFRPCDTVDEHCTHYCIVSHNLGIALCYHHNHTTSALTTFSFYVNVLVRRLGLVLLHERFKTGSKWEAYIQNLPEKFRGIPLSSFSAVDIRALQDRDLAMAIDER